MDQPRPCRVEHCLKLATRGLLCSMHEARKNRHHDFFHVGSVRTNSPDKEIQFWKRVKKTANCWLWTAGKHSSGYGKFSKQYAHRYSFILANGPIPKGMLVRHSCDNPPCVNPAHLLVGTDKDNSKDAMERGRISLGEARHHTVLNRWQVRKIRKLRAAGGCTFKKLGEIFGVTEGAVQAIIYKKSWRWLK